MGGRLGSFRGTPEDAGVIQQPQSTIHVRYSGLISPLSLVWRTMDTSLNTVVISFMWFYLASIIMSTSIILT